MRELATLGDASIGTLENHLWGAANQFRVNSGSGLTAEDYRGRILGTG